MDDFLFINCSSPFFLVIKLHCTFPYLIKYCNILFVVIVFRLLRYNLTPLFLPSSSDSLSYFILTVPMRECLGKQSCMSCPFPIAILNGISYFFAKQQIEMVEESSILEMIIILVLL